MTVEVARRIVTEAGKARWVIPATAGGFARDLFFIVVRDDKGEEVIRYGPLVARALPNNATVHLEA